MTRKICKVYNGDKKEGCYEERKHVRTDNQTDMRYIDRIGGDYHARIYLAFWRILNFVFPKRLSREQRLFLFFFAKIAPLTMERTLYF